MDNYYVKFIVCGPPAPPPLVVLYNSSWRWLMRFFPLENKQSHGKSRRYGCLNGLRFIRFFF